MVGPLLSVKVLKSWKDGEQSLCVLTVSHPVLCSHITLIWTKNTHRFSGKDPLPAILPATPLVKGLGVSLWRDAGASQIFARSSFPP